MENTLEFRAWVYPETADGKGRMETSCFGMCNNGNWWQFADQGYYINKEGMPKEFEPLQYTGLRDSTRTEEYPEGKKIFEGDILSKKWLCVVYKDKNTGAFMVRFGNYPNCNKPRTLYRWIKERNGAKTQDIDCAVIGNIYENPELLNK